MYWKFDKLINWLIEYLLILLNIWYWILAILKLRSSLDWLVITARKRRCHFFLWTKRIRLSKEEQCGWKWDWTCGCIDGICVEATEGVGTLNQVSFIFMLIIIIIMLIIIIILIIIYNTGSIVIVDVIFNFNFNFNFILLLIVW